MGEGDTTSTYQDAMARKVEQDATFASNNVVTVSDVQSTHRKCILRCI